MRSVLIGAGVAVALLVAGCGGAQGAGGAARPAKATGGPGGGCAPAPAEWVKRLEGKLLVPGGRLRHAVIVGPVAGTDLGRAVLEGKVFAIAAELDGATKEGDGDVATWMVGDPYGDVAAWVVIAADRNAYDHSPLGVEMYGGGEYSVPEALQAHDCVLRLEGGRAA